MDIETLIREIALEVFDEINGTRAVPDPVLITVKDVVDLVNKNNAADDRPIGREAIDNLIKNAGTNGFPAVTLGPKTIRIDKMRLNRWLATGGLGVKA